MRGDGRPRLAFLHEDPCQRGGGEAILERLSRLAAAHVPVDLGLVFGCSEPLATAGWAHFARVGVFDFPHRLRWYAAGALARNRRALGRWLGEGGVRACVAMTFAAGLRGALATAGTATPLVWMCTFSVRAQGRWRQLRRSMALRALGLSGALAVCPSVAARDELVELGYPADRIRVINFGVDLQPFLAARMDEPSRRDFRVRNGIPSAELVALHLARLDPIKNHSLLLRAVALAAKQGVRVALICLGDTSPSHAGYAAGLRVQAAELGIADQVLFPGRRDEVTAWLAASDVAVLSSHSETAGLALIEGAASGLPLLSSPVGSAAELVVPGKSGYLFDSAEACAQHLMALAKSPDCRRQLGAEARRLAETSYDARQTDARWLELFGALLDLGSSSPAAAREATT